MDLIGNKTKLLWVSGTLLSWILSWFLISFLDVLSLLTMACSKDLAGLSPFLHWLTFSVLQVRRLRFHLSWGDREWYNIRFVCFFVYLKYCFDLVFRLDQTLINSPVKQLITSTAKLFPLLGSHTWGILYAPALITAGPVIRQLEIAPRPWNPPNYSNYPIHEGVYET